MPYIEEASTYSRLDLGAGTECRSGVNGPLLMNRRWPFQICPSNPDGAVIASYYGTNTHGAAYVPCSGPRNYFNSDSDCTVAGNPSYCYDTGAADSLVNKRSGMVWYSGDVQGVFTSMKDITDGTSKTLAFGEVLPQNNGYFGLFVVGLHAFPTNTKINSTRRQITAGAAFPTDTWDVGPRRNGGMGSQHIGGAHASMIDGAVRFLSDNIDFATFNYLGNRKDGQTVSDY